MPSCFASRLCQIRARQIHFGRGLHLLLLLRDLDAHLLVDDEAGDALVAQLGIDGREDEEDLGLVSVQRRCISKAGIRVSKQKEYHNMKRTSW